MSKGKKKVKDKLKEIQEQLDLPLDERGIIVLAFDNSQDRQTCYLKGIEHTLKWVLDNG